MHAWELNPHPIHVPVAEHLNYWATKPSYVVEFINLNTHYRSPDLLSLSFEFFSKSNLSPSLPCHTTITTTPLRPQPSPSPLQPTPPPLQQQGKEEKGDDNDDDQGPRRRCILTHVCFFIHFLFILLTIIYRYDVYDNYNTGTTTTTSATSSTTSTGMTTTSIWVSAPCMFF